MTENDKMYMQILSVENADVYVAKGKYYRWLDHLDQIAQVGQVFNTNTGWEYYVVGVGNTFSKGTFTFSLWVEKDVYTHSGE